MSTPLPGEVPPVWLSALLHRIGAIEEQKLSANPASASSFLIRRKLSEAEEQEISRIVERTCASLAAGTPFVTPQHHAAETPQPSHANELLVALHRNGAVVDPEVLRKLEAYRKQARAQRP